MVDKMVEKDERTIYVENISYKFGYLFIAFAILLDVVYRSFKLNETSWDLLVIVIISGFVMAIYQYQQRNLGKSWTRTISITIIVSIIIGSILAFISKLR